MEQQTLEFLKSPLFSNLFGGEPLEIVLIGGDVPFDNDKQFLRYSQVLHEINRASSQTTYRERFLGISNVLQVKLIASKMESLYLRLTRRITKNSAKHLKLLPNT